MGPETTLGVWEEIGQRVAVGMRGQESESRGPKGLGIRAGVWGMKDAVGWENPQGCSERGS